MRRLMALIRKETLQILRDPSTFLIAFLQPLILLFIFGYGVNLDSNRIRIGLVVEDSTPDTASLARAFTNSRFLEVRLGQDRREFEHDLVIGHIRGIVVVPQDFSIDMALKTGAVNLQVIADGAEPNIASFVQNYTFGVVQVWLQHEAEDRGQSAAALPIRVLPRFWYNAELKSRNFLVPGSIAIIMTLIGTMLTALVISREWERGTMESMMATPVTITQILLGKLIPYFIMGIGSMSLCTLVCTLVYDVPFRGTYPALLAATSVFLLAALGQGLLISSVAKDQFVASQIALMAAFLPALMLSGFIFEIHSMPRPIQLLTHIFAVRYFVTSLQTLFLTGNVWPLLINCMAAMLVISVVFFALTALKTKKRLDA